MNSKMLLVSGLFLFAAACATHNDVRPGENGLNRVVIQTDDKEEGSRDAIRQATNYCKEFEKHPAFVDENQKYTGDMEESKYKNAKMASKIAKGVGTAGFVFGGKNESAVGGIAALGGHVADDVLGKGYTVEMKFKCN